MFLDGFQVQYFCARVNDRLQFDSRKSLQHELNRFVTLYSRRIDVYIRRKLYIGNQAYSASRYDAAIRLCQDKPEMRRFDALAHFRTQLRKKLGDEIVGGQSIGVFRGEILFANDSAGVDVEESRVGHPFGHSLRFCVEHVELANDFGTRVSQKRKVDSVALGEILQDGRTIVADRRQVKALRFESLFCALQLHELRFAEGSPVGRTEEEKNSAVRSFKRLVGLLMPE